MRKALPPSLLLVISACTHVPGPAVLDLTGPGIDGASGDAAAVDGSGADGASCRPQSQWVLPGGGKRFDATGNASCGFRYHSTLDLDGDLRPDLVETFDCIGGSDEGSKYWLVYGNTGGGFAAAAVQWTLPGGGKRFDATQNTTCGFRSYSTVDLDGDLRPDLVETFDCVGGSDEGSKYWLVHRNTGTGFAPAVQWPLPGGGKRFDSTQNGTCGFHYYATFDIDGDRKPDLVETFDCVGGSDEGSKYWLVYRNTGTGFAAAVQWPLPGGGKRFDATQNGTCGSRYYTTLDMDGDLRPDLVETFDCAGGSDEGGKYWLVHRNTGIGFAPAVQWPLPGGGKRFDATQNTTCGFRYYATFDMDGDLRPELVETFDCMGGSDEGSKYWLVHRNTGTGFAPAVQWMLPGGGKRFDATQNTTCGFRYYATLDLTGDRKPELVETFDCAGGSAEGSDYWLVYPALCRP